MKTNNENIPEILRRTSNAILAFVVLQSIVLAYQLTTPTFSEKVTDSPFFVYYIIIGQLIILIGSIIAIIYYAKKIRSFLDKETNKLVNPKRNVFIKVSLLLYFGVIPILILLKNLYFLDSLVNLYCLVEKKLKIGELGDSNN